MERFTKEGKYTNFKKFDFTPFINEAARVKQEKKNRSDD